MAFMAAFELPSSYKGLYFTSPSTPPEITSFPTPTVDVGSVIVKPLYCWIPGYINDVYGKDNPRQYPVPFPLVGGTNAVGRIVAIPSDAAKLKVGDLVVVDPTIHPRDDSGQIMLLGLLAATGEMKALAKDVWHHGTWAELVKAPLESVHRFDEAALQKQGVSPRDLVFFGQMVVPYAGLRDVNLTAGETVLISPATGNFGGAAVHVALAMGARVIAMGRNEKVLGELRDLAPGRVETVSISGSWETDLSEISKFGPVDVFLDLTPQTAANTDHIRAGLLSVQAGGRVNLMSGVSEITISPPLLQFRGLTIRATMMCTWSQQRDLVKLVQTGVLKLGEKAGLKVQGAFKMEEFAKALETAEKESSAGRSVVFAPNEE
ncbi:alcohol dehydrogenase GroES domain-containing protein [Colletotrichum navitas]|uniref:Alcohol dehydrogenase GroES domain-containing protein n=1 Tax=Colletotrichum navitas TaxID=681940 RepID=A0AAD8PM37_9PEZI|nr:alcohol dehydrogenase GroES domain-containing protein [Colletotrichum navitas]KAK1570171.1 alcohol dehydrogenase GroES domain-containing protein [Colletotrichum navitas]